METIKDNSRCLASLAVFRELYDNEKDVYTIISEFLKKTIKSEGKYSFSLNEITVLLNNNYDFKIPEAVVKTALKRIKNIRKEKKQYIVDSKADNIQNNEIEKKDSNIKNHNNLIIKQLFQYIQDKEKKELSDIEQKNLINSFCSYMLDESIQDNFTEYISAFIVDCQKNADFSKYLKTIKEGVVLYTGLKYNSNINKTGRWETELTIYIETEILFHFIGYNGELYKLLFNDFFSLINEINTNHKNKTGKNIIHLKYFQEVENEIECFFRKAEDIVNGQITLDPSKTAMSTIVNGCKTPSDVISKKTSFYKQLQTHGISILNEKNFYSKENFQYNIESKEINEYLIDTYALTPNSFSENLKFLNYINILRKGVSCSSFEDIGVILLSGNSTTINIAWDKKIKNNGNVPLATSLSFLTNKLWFKLGKSFGKNCYPKTFDIITKAQIILSTQVNNSISEKYDSLQIDLKAGKLKKEEAIATIIELRNQAKKPEEIDLEELPEVLNSISENNIQEYLEEQTYLSIKRKEKEEENKLLKTQLQEKSKELSEKKALIKSQNSQIQQEPINTLNAIKSFRKKRLSYQISRKKYVSHKLKIEHKKNIKNLLFYLIFIIVIISILISILIFIQKDQILTTIITAVIPIFFGYFKHKKAKKTIQYIFVKTKRKKENRLLICKSIHEYNKKETRPVLHL